MKQISKSRGFTILEMIVVLVMIGLIMGLVGPRLFNQADKAKVKTAETQVKMLKGALQVMRLDIGRFPTTTEGLQLLSTSPTNANIKDKWQGPYLEDKLPLDPWSNPFQYRFEASETQAFVLYSQGSDRQDGGEDDASDIGYLSRQ